MLVSTMVSTVLNPPILQQRDGLNTASNQFWWGTLIVNLISSVFAYNNVNMHSYDCRIYVMYRCALIHIFTYCVHHLNSICSFLSFSAHAVKTWLRFLWMYLWRNSSQIAMNSGWQGEMWYPSITRGPPQRLRSSWGSPSMTSPATVTAAPLRTVGRMESGRGGSYTAYTVHA